MKKFEKRGDWIRMITSDEIRPKYWLNMINKFLFPFKSDNSPTVLVCDNDIDRIMGTPKEGKDMTFSDALDKVINFGYKAYRKGWNGKNQFIYKVLDRKPTRL